jgi:hypothetical protein
MGWKEKGGRKLRARNGKKIRTDKSRMKEKHREEGARRRERNKAAYQFEHRIHDLHFPFRKQSQNSGEDTRKSTHESDHV